MRIGFIVTTQQLTSDLVRSYKMEIIIEEKTGLEFVFIVNDDGTTLSMLKSTYDEQQAAINE
jgi:hypothetical protein